MDYRADVVFAVVVKVAYVGETRGAVEHFEVDRISRVDGRKSGSGVLSQSGESLSLEWQVSDMPTYHSQCRPGSRDRQSTSRASKWRDMAVSKNEVRGVQEHSSTFRRKYGYSRIAPGATTTYTVAMRLWDACRVTSTILA